jgi:hypothetical protein
MTMLLFAPLDKAKHVTENINESTMVVVDRSIDKIRYNMIRYNRSIVQIAIITVNMYNLQRNLLYESGLQI